MDFRRFCFFYNVALECNTSFIKPSSKIHRCVFYLKAADGSVGTDTTVIRGGQLVHDNKCPFIIRNINGFAVAVPGD